MNRDSKNAKFGDVAPSAFPGERLGLPRSGPRSVARVGRRIFALILDWAIASTLVYALLRGQVDPLAQLLVFAALQIIPLVLLRGSMGHLIFGMRLASLHTDKDGIWAAVWRPVVRTLLLCLVVPALVWDSDQRAFHDKIAGTVLLVK